MERGFSGKNNWESQIIYNIAFMEKQTHKIATKYMI